MAKTRQSWRSAALWGFLAGATAVIHVQWMPAQYASVRADAQYSLPDSYAERCVEPTLAFDRVGIYFNHQPELRRGDSHDFSVKIAPLTHVERDNPDRELQDELQVTCTISARLVVAASDTSVAPSDWQQQVFMPPVPVEWHWLIAPQRAGEVTARVEVRPVLRVQVGEETESVDYTTASYPVDLLVEQSFLQRIQSMAAQAQTPITAATAAGALLGAFGLKKWGPPLWRRVRQSNPTRRQGRGKHVG